VVFGIGDTRNGGRVRHTFCSRLAQAGVSLKVTQEAAGRKAIAMSARDAPMDPHNSENAMSF